MAEEATTIEQPLPAQEVPEFYVDASAFYASVYDLVIEHGLRYPSASPTGPVPQVRIRMSLPHAWVVAKILNKVMREHVAKLGPISLPKAVLAELKLEDEYRQDMGGHGESGPTDR
jgi:hypothetical protein